MRGLRDPRSDAKEWAQATRLVHAGDSAQARLGFAAKGANPPVQRASTVILPDAASLYAADRPSYGRGGLGVQASLEAALCELEGAVAAKVFSSGAAAVTAALMTVLSAGDEVLVSAGAYAPTRRFCDGMLSRFGVRTRYLSILALTKTASGGADGFMGSVAVRDPSLGERLLQTGWDTGWAVSPDDCYTVLRSLRTLPLRLARHGVSALQVAEWLAGQPEVAQVLCAALPASPGHAIWRRDFSGTNGLVGLVLKPGPARAADAFLDALRLFQLGFSWGGFESLAVSGDPQVRNPGRGWRADGALMRLHVGLEAPEDLTADLRGGLDAFAAACEEA